MRRKSRRHPLAKPGGQTYNMATMKHLTGDRVKKMLFVLNPCAGTKKATKSLADILAVFNRANYDVQVYITDAQGDAIRAVQTHGAGKDLVVCCGGDGTFNETVSGLLQSGLQIPVGYIPAG